MSMLCCTTHVLGVHYVQRTQGIAGMFMRVHKDDTNMKECRGTTLWHAMPLIEADNSTGTCGGQQVGASEGATKRFRMGVGAGRTHDNTW